ncbi:MAG TPA: FkbM family methyltransferase [Solirubrobacterales bacterium]|nr:FkbM family methyltransferase [Solirubrobacterales bacterium]
MSRADRYEIDGVGFTLRDPDASTVRETVPGHSYEPGVTRLLRALLQKGEPTFVDIGALYGYFALYAAALNPRCRVHAVEPHPQYHDVLTANVRDNGVAVECHRVAFSDTTGAVGMRGKALEGPRAGRPLQSLARGAARSLARRSAAKASSEHGSGAATDGLARRVSLLEWGGAALKHTVRSARRAARPAATVAALRYDDWADQNGVRADVVKIDVHGAEGMVLAGMAASLRHLDSVLVEVHSPQMMLGHGPSEVLDMLENGGFRLYEVVGFRTDAAGVEALVGKRRRDFADPGGWTLGDLSLMRMVFASKRSEAELLAG